MLMPKISSFEKAEWVATFDFDSLPGMFVQGLKSKVLRVSETEFTW